MAYVKLFEGFGKRPPSVTKLLETAGISRTEFYLYYKNFADFYNAYTDRVIYTAVNFGYRVCVYAPERAAELVKSFVELNYQMVQKTLRTVSLSGDLILYFSGLIAIVYGYICRVENLHLSEKDERRLLYFIGGKASYCLTYYLGMIDDQTLLEGLEKIQAYAKEWMEQHQVAALNGAVWDK